MPGSPTRLPSSESTARGAGSDNPLLAIAFEALLEHSADALAVVDAQGIVRYWSRGAERMFLFTREEVLGRPVGFIVPQDLLQEGELGRIQHKLERGESVRNHVTRRVRKDGVERRVSLTRTSVFDAEGHLVGSTAIFHDLTELLETEAELLRARQQALAGELAAKVAHEIKNPLAGIGAAIQALSRELAPSDPRREVFAGIMHQIRRLDDTVLDLLRFARPTPPHKVPMALASLVDDLLEPLRRRFGDSEVRFECDIEVGLELCADGRLLGQVLENLLINAAQAVDRAGRVRLHAHREKGWILIEVSDTGTGIPPENLERIFDPFFTTKSRGTGLGLAVARKNAESHGGTLEAANLPRGGALFRLRLPA